MDWKKLETAPHDGTIVWLAIKVPFLDKTYPLLCRYDSWNHEWRKMSGGETVEYSTIDAWQECPIPKLPGIVKFPLRPESGCG